MNWFKSKPEPDTTGQSDVQVIRTKLAECQAQVEAAEAQLHGVSISAALDENPQAGEQAIKRLADLRGRKELLEHALAAAILTERENAGRLNAREHEARKRSLSQKSGQLRRDQQAVTKALCDLRDAYRAMVRDGQGIAALLPPSMRDDFEGLITQGAIKKLVEVENYRVSADGLPNPGVTHKPLYSDEIPPLADTIEQRISNLKDGLEKVGPVAGQAARPQSGMFPPAAPALPLPSPQPADYSVDLRGRNTITGEPKPAEPVMMEAANE